MEEVQKQNEPVTINLTVTIKYKGEDGKVYDNMLDLVKGQLNKYAASGSEVEARFPDPMMGPVGELWKKLGEYSLIDLNKLTDLDHSVVEEACLDIENGLRAYRVAYAQIAPVFEAAERGQAPLFGQEDYGRFNELQRAAEREAQKVKAAGTLLLRTLGNGSQEK